MEGANSQGINIEDGGGSIPELMVSPPSQIGVPAEMDKSTSIMALEPGCTEAVVLRYLEITGKTAEQYSLYVEGRSQTVKEKFSRGMQDGHVRNESIRDIGDPLLNAVPLLVAWQLLMEHLYETKPDVFHFLRILAILNHESINLMLFLLLKPSLGIETGTWNIINAASVPTWLVNHFVDEEAIKIDHIQNSLDFLVSLQLLSLSQKNQEEEARNGSQQNQPDSEEGEEHNWIFSIHPLLQDWIILSMTCEERSDFFKQSITALFRALPGHNFAGCFRENRFDLSVGQWTLGDPSLSKMLRDEYVLPYFQSWAEFATRFSHQRDYQTLEILKVAALCENTSNVDVRVAMLAEEKLGLLDPEAEDPRCILDGLDIVVKLICDSSKDVAVEVARRLRRQAMDLLGLYHPVTFETTIHLLNALKLFRDEPEDTQIIQDLQKELDDSIVALSFNPHLMYLDWYDALTLAKHPLKQFADDTETKDACSPNSTCHDSKVRRACQETLLGLYWQEQAWFNRAMVLSKKDMHNSAGMLFSYLAKYDSVTLDSDLEIRAKSEIARLCMIKNLGPQAAMALGDLKSIYSIVRRSCNGVVRYDLVEASRRLGFAFCLNNDGEAAFGVFVEHFLLKWLHDTQLGIAPLVRSLRRKNRIVSEEDTEVDGDLINIDNMQRWSMSELAFQYLYNQEALESLVRRFKDRDTWDEWEPVTDGSKDDKTESDTDDLQLLSEKVTFCAFRMVSMYCDWDEKANEWEYRTHDPSIGQLAEAFNMLLGHRPRGLLQRIDENFGRWDAKELYLRTP